MLSRSVVHQKSHDTSPSCLFWHQTHMHQAWVGNIENYVTKQCQCLDLQPPFALFVWLFFHVWLPRCHIVKQFSHLAPVYFFNLYIGLWEIFGLNWNITLNLPLMSMHAFSLESFNHKSHPNLVHEHHWASDCTTCMQDIIHWNCHEKQNIQHLRAH